MVGGMTLQDIKRAVESGETVHWASVAYRVVLDAVGQWIIVCSHNDHAVGLTWRDGVTLNGEPEQFFVGRA